MRKQNYGISEQQYWQTYTDQEGLCAICGKPETGTQRNKVKTLSVDHNHDTGAIRGLLCHSCNIAIGMMHEDTSIMEKAAAYIRSFV